MWATEDSHEKNTTLRTYTWQMGTRPIERTSVRQYRDELLAFSEYLYSIGDDHYSSLFNRMAWRLQAAPSMREVRAVQATARACLRGTIGTINDAPPAKSRSDHYFFTGTMIEFYETHDRHMHVFTKRARQIFWR